MSTIINVRIWKGFWTKDDCIKNPHAMFIFDDNDIKRGKRGQAVIRDCPNAFGIPTKKLPSREVNAYYTDTEFEENKDKIDEAITEITEIYCDLYTTIYYPAEGIGTGLAQLQTCAPKTFEYLNERIYEVFGIKNI